MVQLVIHNSRRRSETRLVPEEWNELNKEQLILIAHILQQQYEGDMLNIMLVQVLFGFSDKEMNKIQPEMMCSLTPYVQWVKKSCTLTKQLIPKLKIKGEQLYGPKSELENLRFSEFALAERELYLWQQEMSDMQQLYRFVACIYRPAKRGYDFEKDEEGDGRIAFNANLLAFYANKLMQSVQVSEAVAITMWYKGCRQKIVTDFSELFDGSSSAGEEEEPNYFELIRAIAKSNIYGSFDAVENMYLYTALLEIVSAIREQHTPIQTPEIRDDEY